MEEISQFQMDNNKALAEVNATLRPDDGLSGNVGVFCQGQSGDTATVMSILKYREEIFGNRNIIWYINYPNADLLRFAHITEVRPWPWAGNGLPVGTPDFYPLLCDKSNRLNKELAKEYELTKDLDDGYFPAAWMRSPVERHGFDYPSISKSIFNVPDNYQWHPFLSFSQDEIEAASKFVESMGTGKKVLIETYAGSGQSILDEGMICEAMNLCLQHWGENCNFVFASHKFLKKNEDFPQYLFEQPNVFSCANFTVRQCALIADRCDLMISVSSGITVAASCWGIKSPPIIQYTGSWVCSTKTIANGEFKLVTADDKKTPEAKRQFYEKLIELLKKYK